MPKFQKNNLRNLLFYTSTPRAFHTYLRYFLLELIKKKEFNIILLADDIYEEDGKGIDVSEIIPVRQYAANGINKWDLNCASQQEAKWLIRKYNPAVIVTSSDYHSLFEMYLFRYGKKNKSLNIAVQWSVIDESKKIREWTDLLRAYSLFPSWVPLSIKLLLVKIRKWIGHYIIYWIYPMLIRERPFGNISSNILKTGTSGLRDADIQYVLSEKDKELFIKEGVPPAKIRISEQLTQELTNEDVGNKIVTLIVPSDMNGAIERGTKKYISRLRQEFCWIEIAGIISETLPDWKVYIRCHPDTKHLFVLKEKFMGLGGNVYWADPCFPPDNAVKKSDLIIGLPPSYSTLLYMAAIQFPKKNIISLDTFGEIMGDYYKDHERIVYIENKEQLITYLKQL